MLKALKDDPAATRIEIASGRDARSFLLLAREDIFSGMMRWRLWTRLGWNDILQIYRRSLLGPLWLTLSTAIMVIALGVLFAEMFKIPLHNFLPFLCVGTLIWDFLSGFFKEGGTLFTGSESYIKQVRLPYSLYVYRATWGKMIILAHNFVIYFGVLMFFQLWPGATALLAIPGLLLVALNGALASLTIGLVSARFRDIPQVVISVMQIIYFMTPIMWKPELLQHRSYIADFNPFFHLIEIVRAPLLGNMPTLTNYSAVLLTTAVNLLVALAFFARYRGRLSYWV